MIVYWSDNALLDMTGINEFISHNNPLNAERFLHRLVDSVENQLSIFPLSGRVVLEFQNPVLRELIRGSYRIIYHIDNETITIIAVKNSNMLLDLSLFNP